MRLYIKARTHINRSAQKNRQIWTAFQHHAPRVARLCENLSQPEQTKTTRLQKSKKLDDTSRMIICALPYATAG